VPPHQLGSGFWPNSGSGSSLMLGLRPRSLEKSLSGAARPSDPVPVPTTQSHETVSVSSQVPGDRSQLHILRYDPKRRCATGVECQRAHVLPTEGLPPHCNPLRQARNQLPRRPSISSRSFWLGVRTLTNRSMWSSRYVHFSVFMIEALIFAFAPYVLFSQQRAAPPPADRRRRCRGGRRVWRRVR
jgi:hypothetical protein